LKLGWGKPPAPSVQAAGKVELSTQTNRPTSWGVGISRLAPAEFIPLDSGLYSREMAMAVPTISRARDLLATSVGGLPLTLWTYDWSNPEAPVEERLPPAKWMLRPDPNRTRQYTIAWTVDDLLFHARAYWRITSRYVNGYPATFEWLPCTDVNIGSDGRVTYRGQLIKPDDLVEFLSPMDGLLAVGWRAISIANNLDNAAERFSTVELPAGWLEQTENSEPLDAEELAEIATAFQAARNVRTVAALNPFLRWRESIMDPSRLQLTEARAHQALELSRLTNIPAYLVGAPSNGMTYSNAAQAKSDLIDFGSLPYVQCIEQTLSGPNVTPLGQFVRLDVNAWLRNPLTPNANATPNDAETAFNEQQPEPPVDDGGRPRDFDGETAT